MRRDDQPPPVPVAGAVRVDRRQRHDAAPAGRRDPPGVQVPAHTVKDGKVVLNIAARAVAPLDLGNDAVRSPRASAASAMRCRCRWRRCWRSTRGKPGRAWRCPRTPARPTRATSRQAAFRSGWRRTAAPRARRASADRQVAPPTTRDLARTCHASPRAQPTSTPRAVEPAAVRAQRCIGTTPCPQRPAEGHESPAAQHQPADVAIAAILRIFEAEAALEPEPAVLAAAQAQPAGVHGLVQPLHAGGAAGIAAHRFGAFGGGAGGAPECERHRAHDHHR